MTRLEAAHALRFKGGIAQRFKGCIMYPPTPGKPYRHSFVVSLGNGGKEFGVLAMIRSDVFKPERPIRLTTRQVLHYLRAWFPRSDPKRMTTKKMIAARLT